MSPRGAIRPILAVLPVLATDVAAATRDSARRNHKWLGQKRLDFLIGINTKNFAKRRTPR
jgi:hypothetical protein